ncbi:MAG: DUF1232 domain-containing protein [Paludibacteraceae bacterium]|nr:DUF1232 domain-containing protein [Paludibacteraceae bacterium]
MQKSTKHKLNIVIGAVIALIYVLIPIDASPDAVPVIGWIDDAVAVLLAIANGIIWGTKLRKRKSKSAETTE